MKLHYAGKFSGNPEDIPHLDHEPGAVPFKEEADQKHLGKLFAMLSIVVFLAAFIPSCIRVGGFFYSKTGVLLYLLTVIPHEFLHAICFKDDVYMFQDLKHGMFFITGPERMSKGWFIFKCLLPGIVFGFIPYIIFMINPELRALGTMGALGISSAAGDFYNVNNAVRQVPNGAWIYQHMYKTYWYMPQK